VLPSPPVAGAHVIPFTKRATGAYPPARRARVAALATVCAVALATPAVPTRVHACAPAEDPAAKFERAEALYAEGRYEETIALLRELLRDYPDPILLYNLGRAYEGADRVAEAIDAYERYVDAAPDAPDRDAVERRIDRLRARLRPQQPPPPEPTPVTEAPREAVPRPIVAPWVLAGIGGAGLVAGATLGGLARARRDAAVEAMAQADAAAHLARAERLATAANVAFGVGGALAIAGVTWGVVAVVKRRRARTGPALTHARVGS
jgi:tetratricopeptide (TPR) repeat protein